MAILQLTMSEHKKQAHSPTNKKSTLLLAQDLSYARNLAANEERVRRKSLKYLKKYLEQRSKASPLTEESLKVLWKGLFYSMWMSDKPLVQEECAENISQLIHCLQFTEAMHFFKIGLVTLQNEWFGIDQLRLDKFLMFVRRLLRQALFVLRKTNFKKHDNEVFAHILEETILTTSRPESVPLGLFMHFTEIYLEELAKVSDGKLQPNITIDLLRPYITKLAFAKDNRVVQWITKFIFTHLMKQHKLGLEYEDKYKIWREQGFAGSINQIQKVIVSDAEPGDSNLESDSPVSTANKPLDPRAGRVDVELPLILFNAKDISEALLIPKSDSRTSKITRKHLTIWSEKFLKLHNGIYPLGVKKLESTMQKNAADSYIDIRKAAKKLIKFEQKLLAKDGKGKKRKRDISESHEEAVDAPKLKKKKKSSETDSSSKVGSAKKAKLKKDKLNKEISSSSSLDAEVKNNLFVSKKAKALELKKAEKKLMLKNKLKKKKVKTNNCVNELDSSIDEYNFCFKRNSGMWYVTPEFGAKTEAAKETPGERNNSGTKDDANNEKCEMFIPSKTFVKKLKKAKNDQEVEAVLSRLRGKSRVDTSK